MKKLTLSRLVTYVRDPKRKSLLVFVVLRGLIALCMARQLYLGNYAYVCLCMVSLLVMTIPTMLHKTLRVRLPGVMSAAIALFVFAAEILGEIANFYGQFPFWDTMLHTINGFLAAAIGFGIIDLVNTHAKGIKMAPLFVALVSFCFSMTVGVCWEFVEFTADQLTRVDMQKDRIVQTISSVELNPTGENDPIVLENIDHTVLYDANGNELWAIEGGYLDIGIIDTMKDLLVNMAGALGFSAFGFLYIHRRDKYKFAGNFIIVQEGAPSGTIPEDPENKEKS